MFETFLSHICRELRINSRRSCYSGLNAEISDNAPFKTIDIEARDDPTNCLNTEEEPVLIISKVNGEWTIKSPELAKHHKCHMH